MQRLQNLLLLPNQIKRLKSQITLQKQFVHDVLHPILEQYYKSNDGTLAAFDFEKITNYYGVGSPVLAGEGIAEMHQQVLDFNTRKTLTFMGAVTGLYDDFFDRSNNSLESIEALANMEIELSGLNTHEQLFRKLSREIFESTSNKNRLLTYSEKVFLAQKESLKQKQNNTSKIDLKNISFNKGGVSLLFYRCSFDQEITAKEQEILYNIGGLVQLCNDIFDVNKDIKEGIRTFATESENIEELKQEIKSIKTKVYQKCLENGTDLNVTGLLKQTNIIFAQSLVALDFYLQTQRNNGKRFTPRKYQREKLVCDMGKKSNLLKAAVYWIKND